MAVTIIRAISDITPDVTIEEQHHDQLVITDHPIQQGTSISDHAYKLPAEVAITYSWATGGKTNTAKASSFLNDLYAKILALQVSGSPFVVLTTRRKYPQMLMQSVTLTTDKNTSEAMVVRMLCREIIVVQVGTVVVSLDSSTHSVPAQTLPASNQGTQSLQNQTTYSGS